ncbi:YHYH domain-containing protein [Helcococcus kunzii]|uniref:YHYH domain-containing protein n=1 Tax=Helcococcus kunzii TaxID=40091 RepID=UPI0021A3444E|nr:YHYH domain-containing protein [Helcococcus kunzii]MCT1796595.1 YHYH domain-containing protein [Helcococcus kunzii]MCT1988761.1 YHYH domain-containing protein [Helcococcus kunzii]
MKNKSKIIILSLAILVTFSGMSSAHPGRTDKNGGHTCRTNCTERWGLFYGEYHHHASDGSYTNSKGERFDKRGNKILSTSDQLPKEDNSSSNIKTQFAEVDTSAAEQAKLDEEKRLEESRREESIKEESIKEESIKEESIKEESIKEESIKEESIKEESIKEESIKELEKSALELESYKEEAKIAKENLEESEGKIESLKEELKSANAQAEKTQSELEKQKQPSLLEGVGALSILGAGGVGIKKYRDKKGKNK